MQRGNLYTVLFATIVCVVSSAALTFVSKGLEPRKALNLEINRQRNVLKAFGYDVKSVKATEIPDLYGKSITEYVVDGNGSVVEGKKPSDIDPEAGKGLLPVYQAKENGEIKGYALPIVGYGLWSWLYGYLALEADLNTVLGITFYQHAETPGLGGEIEAPWFTGNFVGKTIFDTNGKLVSVTVVKGKVDEVVSDPETRSHCVDGISGATMTSDGVTALIKEGLETYKPHLVNLRGRSST